MAPLHLREDMKVIVCLKEVVDTRLSLDFGLTNRVVFNEGLPLRLNPNDAAALAMALALKQAGSGIPVEISLISIGKERVESYLRGGLALGADKALRVWEEEFTSLSPYQKARLLYRTVSFSGADLVFTGANSLDIGDGQVGPLMAVWLDMPCICEVVNIDLSNGGKNITLTRDIGRGAREKLHCPLPAVVTVKGEGKLPYASMDSFIASQCSEVTRLSCADLGVSPAALKDDPTKVIGLTFPRPGTKKVVTPDSSLPAFDRILKLLEGGVSRRKSKILQGGSDELADHLFELLIAEGVITPAPKRVTK
jgi:electron transfer flavoprotein beta subunit